MKEGRVGEALQEESSLCIEHSQAFWTLDLGRVASCIDRGDLHVRYGEALKEFSIYIICLWVCLITKHHLIVKFWYICLWRRTLIYSC
jgi:hypothetical protein